MKSIKIKIKKPPKVKTSKNELYLIKKKFLEDNYEGFSAWGAGMKIMQELCVLVPNIDFWKTFKCKYPVYWLRSEKGKSFILDSFEKWLKQQIGAKLLSKKEETQYTLQDTKVGADFEQLAAKPKSLKDFLEDN